MPRPRAFGPAEGGLAGLFAQLVYQPLHCSSVALKALG
jgi:hypothetical protein